MSLDRRSQPTVLGCPHSFTNPQTQSVSHLVPDVCLLLVPLLPLERGPQALKEVVTLLLLVVLIVFLMTLGAMDVVVIVRVL